MYGFKNKEDTLIVVYCEDERISTDFAKTLVDRGIDNVFLLTGGIRDFASNYPLYTEGDFSVYENMKASPKKKSSGR